MKIAVIIARVLVGLAFIVFGLNILHPFMVPPPMPEGSLPAQFMNVMGPTHWMQLVGLFQLLGGVFVIIGRTAPLGLAMLAPVLVNILAFHTFLTAGEGIAGGVVFSVLEIFLIYAYRNNFRGIFTTHAQPSV